MDEVETIYFGEDDRVVVYYDDITEDPHEWGWGVTAHKIDRGYDWVIYETGDSEIARMFNALVEYGLNTEQVKRALHIYNVWLGNDTVVEFHDVHQGRDRFTLLCEGGNTAEIKSFVEVYTAYLNGEVYMLEHQKRKTWTGEDEDDTMDTWEHEDVIYGVYHLNESYEELARQYFDLPKDKE